MTLTEATTETLLRASVRATKESVYFLNSSTFQPTASITYPVISTYGVLSVKEYTLDWFTHNIQYSNSTSKLLSSLVDGSALSVSDGSYYPVQQVDFYGWIIASSD